MDGWMYGGGICGIMAKEQQPANLLEFISTGRKEEGVFNKF